MGSGQFKFVTIDEDGIVRELSSQSSIQSQDESPDQKLESEEESKDQPFKNIMSSGLARSMRVPNYRLTTSTKSENDDEANLGLEIDRMIKAACAVVQKLNSV